MARDDERIWAELVENFHSSPSSDRPQWPAAENLDPEVDAAGHDRPAGAADTPAGLETDPPDRDSGAAGHDTDAAGLAGRPAGEDTASPTGDNDAAAGLGGRPAAPGSAGHDPEEHFVPPAPPPLPRTDLITRLAWLCVLGTPLFFLLAVIAGRPVSGTVGALGAAAFIGGFVLLVMRLRGHDPYDPDDGAVV